MAKSKTLYACAECGAQATKWAGQCADCGAWNTLVETIAEAASAGRSARFAGYGQAGDARVQNLTDVAPDAAVRVPTTIGELDRVLGGGLVPGSVVLLGGDPGIGKSTVLLQTLAGLVPRLSNLYVTGEESLQQV